METQIELARKAIITTEMTQVAEQEGLDSEWIRERVAEGRIVIPVNPNRKNQKSVGIGFGLRTKVNASIGTSSDITDFNLEIRKARVAEEEKADTLMELSTGGNLDEVRRLILDNCSLPVGNVPLYQAFSEASRRYHNPNKLDSEHLFEIIEKHIINYLNLILEYQSVSFIA